MGKLEEKSDGYYVLEAKMGVVNIHKVFKEVEPDTEISEKPMKNGFFLNIPDRN